jgi:hypothetical protein
LTRNYIKPQKLASEKNVFEGLYTKEYQIFSRGCVSGGMGTLPSQNVAAMLILTPTNHNEKFKRN